VVFEWKFCFTCPRIIWLIIKMYQCYLKFLRNCQFMNSAVLAPSHINNARKIIDYFRSSQSQPSLEASSVMRALLIARQLQHWWRNESLRTWTGHNCKHYFIHKLTLQHSKFYLYGEQILTNQKPVWKSFQFSYFTI
jgi:hypothetical protein